MPGFNGSGTFVRTHDWTQDRSNGVTVNADRMDAEHDGFATGLSTCITKDGQTTVTADLPMNTHKFTGLAAGTTTGDSVRFEQVFPSLPTAITATPTTLDTTYVGKLVPFDATSAAITVTLPSAVSVGNGGEITIVKSDPTANFITINSASSQLIGYPGRTIAFHGTAGTAVSNNGGFVRVTMNTENRVFMTGDKVRISGVVGFAGLNADFTITRPSSASGVSTTAIDLTLPYAAGYTSGGTVAWIQTSQQLRVCNGSVTYISNGTHWVVKHATPDVWQGPKNNLLGMRNVDYDDAAFQTSGSTYKNLDGLVSSDTLRPYFKSLALGEDGDPVDIRIARFEKDYLSSATATSVQAAAALGSIYGQGSNQNGTCQGQSGSLAFVAAENITTAGQGGHARLGGTPLGDSESQLYVDVRENGDVWLGGLFERGTILAERGTSTGRWATGVLTAAANPADGDTVTIDTVVYTFESGSLDASTPTAVEVLLGASASASLDNLIAAINLTGTQGTTYGTGTARHTTVYAMAGAGDTVDLKARSAGTAGNSIVTTETGANLSFGAATLTGGEATNLSHVAVRGQPTGTYVTLRADAIIGGINHTSLRLDARGTAYILTNDPIHSNTTATSINTAGAATYTAAQMLGGIIVRDCAGSGRTDTLPTAALMVAAIPGAAIGDTVRCYVVNGSDAAETITLAEGSGGAWDANQTAASRVIPQNSSKMVMVRLTNVTASSEAYVVYA
jgi:hypothetical protein